MEYSVENGIELAKEIIREVTNKVKRVYWTNEQIDNLFGKRSAKEIIQNGTTCFMNPCLDLTLVSSYLMFSRGIQHQFVIEEHLPTPEFNFNRLHFVLEFQHENKIYGMNYKKCNEVYIYEGNYNGREDIPRASMMKISGESINPYKTLHENLGYKRLEDLTKEKFIGYSLEKNLERLKQDNSKERYGVYKQKYGEKINIILEPQNQLSA